MLQLLLSLWPRTRYTFRCESVCHLCHTFVVAVVVVNVADVAHVAIAAVLVAIVAVVVPVSFFLLPAQLDAARFALPGRELILFVIATFRAL